MPGRVWTLAVWFSGVVILLGVSLLFPMNPEGLRLPWLRVLFMLIAVGVVVSLLVLKERTPRWYLGSQASLVIVSTLILVSLARTPLGAVTSGMSLVAVAAYLGFWMEPRVSVPLILAGCLGLLGALSRAGFVPQTVVPWALISALSLGLLACFSALVTDMNRRLVTDPLTGLLNRAGLARLLESGAERIPSPRVVVAIDLDQFKVINDQLGHLAGDAVLVDVGAVIGRVMRAGDIAIRSGGDEFLLILPRTSITEARALVESLRGQAPEAFSFGATEWVGSEPIDAALGRADRSMYEEKAERARTHVNPGRERPTHQGS